MKRLCGMAVALLLILGLTSEGQTTSRTKIAEGEYSVTSQDDRGVGPLETEVFNFHESWTLWWASNNLYQLEGRRTYDSPQDELREEDFNAVLSPSFDLEKVVLRSHLRFVRDSGPFLTCTNANHELVCDSGGKDPVHTYHIQVTQDQPSAIIWPISVFSMAHLAFLASEQETKPVKVGLIQIREIDAVLPVMSIQSGGTIQYLGRCSVAYTIPGMTWFPRAYRLISETTRTLYIWTSTEGIVLAIQEANSPGTKIQLIRFTQYAPFPNR